MPPIALLPEKGPTSAQQFLTTFITSAMQGAKQGRQEDYDRQVLDAILSGKDPREALQVPQQGGIGGFIGNVVGGRPSMQNMSPFTQQVLSTVVGQKLQDPLVRQIQTANLENIKANIEWTKEGRSAAMRLIPGDKNYWRFNTDTNNWEETGVPVPSKTKGAYTDPITAGPNDPLKLPEGTVYQMGPENQLVISHNPAKESKPANLEETTRWNSQLGFEEKGKFNPTTGDYIWSGLMAKAPQEAKAPTQNTYFNEKTGRREYREWKGNQWVGTGVPVEGPQKQGDKAFSIEETNDYQAYIQELLNEASQEGPVNPQTIYEKAKRGVGYNSFKPSQKGQFDEFWNSATGNQTSSPQANQPDRQSLLLTYKQLGNGQTPESIAFADKYLVPATQGPLMEAPAPQDENLQANVGNDFAGGGFVSPVTGAGSAERIIGKRSDFIKKADYVKMAEKYGLEPTNRTDVYRGSKTGELNIEGVPDWKLRYGMAREEDFQRAAELKQQDIDREITDPLNRRMPWQPHRW